MDKDIIKFRQWLHAHPELSGQEVQTAKHIAGFMQGFKPDKTVELAGNGLAFVFEGEEAGPTVMFRADIDALPITEQNSIDHISGNEGVAHLCGHDGHTAIMLQTAERISKDRPGKGKVICLFQPEEETGQGANRLLQHESFSEVQPDYVFGLHNIPGYPLHKLLLRKGSFAAASKGMIVKLYGKTSHAAEPEMGNSPANAVARIIDGLHAVLEDRADYKALVLLTIINIKLGEIAFGTTPGYAEVRVTLRAFENQDMEILTQRAEKVVNKAAVNDGLQLSIDYTEVFPATENTNKCVDWVKQVAHQNKMDIQWLEKPFKWSEDFGYYTLQFPGAFFGLGSGVDHPQLHNPDYDFPDELIESGSALFYGLYKEILG
jgi:amidohydrolase